MIFAAKATVDHWAWKRAERQREEILKEERERIAKVLEALSERGMPLTPEQAKALTGKGNNG